MCLFNLFLIKNFRFSNNEVVNFGRAAIYLSDSLDSTIENNLFENIYMTGLGYSVAVTNACNNILIRNNDFEVKGRHYITAGAGTGTRSSGGFVRNMKVVNNTFENCVQEAINSHPPFVGPIEIIRNRFEFCGKGIEISNGNTAIVENNFTNCSIAIQLLGDEARVHNIYSNEFKDCRERILVETSNMTIYGDICNGQFLVKRDEIEFL
jgi:parallel beta-helix repeat protein